MAVKPLTCINNVGVRGDCTLSLGAKQLVAVWAINSAGLGVSTNGRALTLRLWGVEFVYEVWLVDRYPGRTTQKEEHLWDNTSTHERWRFEPFCPQQTAFVVSASLYLQCAA